MVFTGSACTVCGYAPLSAALYSYAKCGGCGSYLYVSDKSAEEENMAYFNRHFLDYDRYGDSRVKKFIFGRASKKDKLCRPDVYEKLKLVSSGLQKTFGKGKKILEVGFGSGKRLLERLENGLDAYGVDLSESAVAGFREKYPQHKDRVFSGTHVDGVYDVVSCDAVLEHIDEPGKFVDNLWKNTAKGGAVVIGAVPVVSSGAADFDAQNDISFWRPCHRIIFSEKGLLMLFEKKGFSLTAGAAVDLYVYRVLSAHLKAGYDKITDARNPKLSMPGFPGLLEFRRICNEAIKARSLALCGTYIFAKNG